MSRASNYYARERRQALEDFEFFKPFISSPYDLGTVAAGNDLPNSFEMPANGHLGLSFDSAHTAGNLLVAAGSGSPVAVKDSDADQIRRALWAEEGEDITVSSLAGLGAGTVFLVIYDDWREPFVIATGTFT